MAQANVADNQAGYNEGYELTVDDALELAKGHHVEGNYLLAERTYRDILNAVPDHFPTIHFLGVLLYQTTVFDEALDYLKMSVEADPKDKQCWNNLGAVYTEMRELDMAIEAYEKALSIDSDFVDALNNKGLALWLSGDLDQAYDVIVRSLALNPDHMDANISKGIILASRREFEKANELWEALAVKYPENSKVFTNWGNTLRDMGRLADSEVKCRKALELDPKNPEAHNNLGNVLRDRGQLEESLDHYKEATDVRPEYVDAHSNKAVALSDLSRHAEAAVSARYAIAFKRDDVRANSAMSLALRNLGEFSEARAASLRAVKASPDLAEPYLDLAEVNLMADILHEAEAALQEALKREPDSARSYKKLADVREKMSDLPGALEAIEKAIEMAPDMPILYVTRGLLFQMENRMDEAFASVKKAQELAPHWYAPVQTLAEMSITVNENEQAEEYVRQAIELNPNVPAPYSTIVSLKTIKSEEDETFQKLLKLYESESRWGLQGVSVMNYALSDAYEQFKDFDKAFMHLNKANDARRKLVPHDAQIAKGRLGAIKARFTKKFFTEFEGKGCESDVPVFIVGMPRSGTTLTEQIISSHPQVFGAGELADLAFVRDEVGAIDPDNAKAFGEDYVRRIKARDKDGVAMRITDKMPANYMNIGVIASALPNARIIHCGRNAIDTCLSCYKQNFANGQYWSYNLEELADEYNNYMEMMNHWSEVLPGRILNIRYEDTVGDFENSARKLIEHIGLEWDDACLSPHKQKRTVLTASKGQVTQPVYKTSVEKWRRYEKHLQPLIDKLNPEALK